MVEGAARGGERSGKVREGAGRVAVGRAGECKAVVVRAGGCKNHSAQVPVVGGHDDGVGDLLRAVARTRGEDRQCCSEEEGPLDGLTLQGQRRQEEIRGAGMLRSWVAVCEETDASRRQGRAGKRVLVLLSKEKAGPAREVEMFGGRVACRLGS